MAENAFKNKIKITDVATQGIIVLAGAPKVTIAKQGLYAGLPVIELKCAYEGFAFDIQNIFEQVKELGLRTLVITGEEPLAQERAIAELLRMFEIAQMKCQVEHEGTISMREFVGFRSATHLVEFKGPSSGKMNKNQPSMINALRPSDQLQFLIKTQADYDYMKKLLASNRSQAGIVLKAENNDVDVDKWLIEDVELRNLFPRDIFKFRVQY